MAKLKKYLNPGNKFNRLTIIKLSTRPPKGSDEYYECQCDCGNKSIVRKSKIIRNETKSCGCYNRETTSKRLRKHGLSNHPCFNNWFNLLVRCRDTKGKWAKNYSARGITYDPRYEDFTEFLKDMGDSYFPGAQLDRVDNDKGYFKGNIRWADRKQQARNKQKNHRITDPYKGDEITVGELAERYEYPQDRLFTRIYRGRKGKNILEPFGIGKSEKSRRENIKEIKQLLWNHTIEDVSILTDTPEWWLIKVRDREIHDDIPEY